MSVFSKEWLENNTLPITDFQQLNITKSLEVLLIINNTIEDAINDMKEKEFKNYFSYAFDKDAIKKIYKMESTLKRKEKVYI